MRTTLALDDEAFAAVRTLAEVQGKSLGKVVSELVLKALESAHSKVAPGDFPVFEVSPNARPVTPEAVRAARDGES